VLQQVLGKLSVMHVSKNVKKNAVPFNLPQLDPKIVSGDLLSQWGWGVGGGAGAESVSAKCCLKWLAAVRRCVCVCVCVEEGGGVKGGGVSEAVSAKWWLASDCQ
jgi:hypothetical protein